ncbi:MAG: hypothetical protein A2Z96_03900 [Spirochaetes bacterium GWB1_48_6]|nr:MAG: hypothetical protein A2Z96_03900 [Spirochaetes bacterium GWB1_48_6]
MNGTYCGGFLLREKIAQILTYSCTLRFSQLFSLAESPPRYGRIQSQWFIFKTYRGLSPSGKHCLNPHGYVGILRLFCFLIYYLDGGFL